MLTDCKVSLKGIHADGSDITIIISQQHALVAVDGCDFRHGIEFFTFHLTILILFILYYTIYPNCVTILTRAD